MHHLSLSGICFLIHFASHLQISHIRVQPIYSFIVVAAFIVRHSLALPFRDKNSSVPEFLSTLRKFCILLHCRALETEVSKRKSTKLCQTVNRKVRLAPPKNWRPKTVYICLVFRRRRDLIANIFWTKQNVYNRARGLESSRGSLYCSKIGFVCSSDSESQQILTGQ